MDYYCITRHDAAYPASLSALMGPDAPSALAVAGPDHGSTDQSLALFCSKLCPGSMILQAYDFVQRLRLHHVTLLSGFHAPMEKECLRTIMGGSAGVVWCLAKSLASFTLPGEFQKLFNDGRLTLISPFPENVKRITAETARYRNLVAAVMADEIFIPFAAPKSSTEAFCNTLLSMDKLVLTLDAPENTSILERGAQPITAKDIDSLWARIISQPAEGDLPELQV